ncbi:MAG: hypothetical protein H7267_11340 [Sandarakinorhabdus sp.]|nr:hypothetical protein [Sandarakinorhabdus sp.]
MVEISAHCVSVSLVMVVALFEERGTVSLQQAGAPAIGMSPPGQSLRSMGGDSMGSEFALLAVEIEQTSDRAQ